MNLGSVVTQMAVLLLIVAVGYLAARFRAVPEGTNHMLAKLVTNVTNPCMVLYSVLGTERVLSNGEVFLLTGIAVGMYALLLPLSFLVTRLLRVPAAERSVYRFLWIFSNMGFLAFPVVSALYGSNAVFYASIFNLMMLLLCFSYGEALLDPAERRFRLSLKRLCTPMIIASLLAYVLYLVDVRAPEVLVQTLGKLTGVSAPVGMLIIGIALTKVKLRQIFGNWRLYVINAARLVLFPLAVYALLRCLTDNLLILGVTVVMCGMPAATLTTVLTAKYGVHEDLAASGVFLSTLLSFVTIPLMMWFLFP